MADMTTNKTFGRLSSQFQKTFKSDGENLMTVAAFFKDHPTKVAAFQTLKFTITSMLSFEIEKQDITVTLGKIWYLLHQFKMIMILWNLCSLYEN